MTDLEYVVSWTGSLDPEMWVAHHLIPLLVIAGSARLVYLLMRPRS